MGISEVVILAMMENMVVLGTALGMLMVPGYWSCRWAKPSHLQYTVYEIGSQAGNLRSRPGEKHS